jgi:hypothetical protein
MSELSGVRDVCEDEVTMVEMEEEVTDEMGEVAMGELGRVVTGEMGEVTMCELGMVVMGGA